MKKTEIDAEMTKLVKEMSEIDIDQDKDRYERRLSAVERLSKVRFNGNNGSEKKRLDPNTVFTVVGSIFELGLIMNFERARIITTKAFSRLIRPRI